MCEPLLREQEGLSHPGRCNRSSAVRRVCWPLRNRHAIAHHAIVEGERCMTTRPSRDTLMTEIRSAGRDVPGITAWDPSAVFVLKSLLYPLAATASLAGSLLLAREPFQHSYFLVAVIAFIATAD